MPRKTVDSAPLYAFDAQLRAAHGRLCGVDEAGRGPLCGPVCCAAVILDPEDPIPGVTDSKKLSAQRREALYQEIVRRALAYCVEFVSPRREKHPLGHDGGHDPGSDRAGSIPGLCAGGR